MTDSYRIIEVARHRNGVAGEPFWAVLFNWTSEEGSTERLLAILHDQPGYCSVIGLDRIASGGVQFGHNSWRGDHFETRLRQEIGKYESKFLEQRCNSLIG